MFVDGRIRKSSHRKTLGDQVSQTISGSLVREIPQPARSRRRRGEAEGHFEMRSNNPQPPRSASRKRSGIFFARAAHEFAVSISTSKISTRPG